MATMYPRPIPESWERDRKKAAEKEVYIELDRVLEDSWHVFWDISWTLKKGRRPPEDCQTDFVLCNPDHGVLLIEVKGGEIRKDRVTRKWTSTDRYGGVHDIRDPARQVENAMYSLKDKMEEVYSWKPIMGRSICLPGCEYNASTIEINREYVIDARDMAKNLRSKILSISEYWKREREMEAFSLPHLEFLKNCLASSLELKNPLGLQIEKTERETLHLTDEQFDLLHMWNGNKRLAICGGAGTGKTVFALEKAKRLASQGFDVLLTCVSRDLEHYLQRCTGRFDRLSILTFNELCRIISEAGGIPISGRRENQTLKDYVENTVPAQLMAALPRTDRRFDAIIVDEAQDFDTHWWPALEACFRDQEDGVLWVFYDDNQNVYQRPSCLPPNTPEIRLSWNFRNTKEIFQVANQFYRGNELKAKGTHGPPVEFIATAGKDDLSESVRKAVKRLFDEKVASSDIAILTPLELNQSPLYKSLRGNPPARPTDFERKIGNVTFQSIPTFKGLESSVVIVCEIDELQGEEAKAQLYVGLSRARSHLIIICENDTFSRIGFNA